MAMENYNGCIFHFNTIMEYDKNGDGTKCTLLSHPLYFLQNGYNDVIDFSNNDNRFRMRAAKALMMLYSMPFNYGNASIKSFFNDRDLTNGGFEVIPYGYLALMGGILYSERYKKEYKVDLIETCDNNNGNLYKTPAEDETFLVKGKDGVISFGIIKNNSSKSYENRNIIFKNNFDLYIENKLIELFLNFVEETTYELDNIEIKYYYSTNTNEIELFSYSSINDLQNELIKLDTVQALQVLFGINSLGGSITICSFSQKYQFGGIKNNRLYFVYKENDSILQSLFDKLYNHKSAVITNVYSSSEEKTNSIKKDIFTAVINGFGDTMVKLCQDYKNEEENKTDKSVEVSRNNSDDDFKKSIYMYMKQFWDKWLCGVYNAMDEDNIGSVRPFSVPWFNKQFLFIDTYYNDVSGSLKLNCDILYELLSSSINSESHTGVHVYTHLANVAERHHCNFFCYPDFIDFNKNNDKGVKEAPEEILSDLFMPIPYNKINKMEVENQFVIIKNTSAQYNANQTNFTSDGFDIWTSENHTAIAPSTFKNSLKRYNDSNNKLRMAYKVPSFGVAFSRQNNHIFKSIEIGMDTIQTTDQSIKSLCYISQRGNSNKHAVTFYGNDIYGIYSAYSYILTITMMGNAQIQPLMYLQLMNVPMFRGTYMIIEVKHSVKPGDFTTTVKAMKLSRVEQPINESWFTIATDESDANKNGDGDNCTQETVNSDGSSAPEGTTK